LTPLLNPLLSQSILLLIHQYIAVPTGTTAVLVHGGERSLVANLAAANTFAHTHMETPQAKAMVARAHIYYSAGFFLTVSVDSMLMVAKESVAHNKIYCLNLSAPFIIQFYKDQLRAMMPYADYLFGNESEAAAYGESMGYGHDISTIALKVKICLYIIYTYLYICMHSSKDCHTALVRALDSLAAT
jgi:adenosine kinase